MNTIALALASATFALGAGAAVYANGPERDAAMSRADVEQRTAEAFARMDANHDGVLDQADRAAMQAHRGERRGDRQDARFESIDTDHDGAISRAEFDGARERFAEHRDGPRERGHRGRMGRFGGPGFARDADADGNHAVNAAEFSASALARFDRADANHDGTVTADERRAAMKAFRDERRAARGDDHS